MAEQTNIEDAQTHRYGDAEEMAKEQVVRQALRVLHPTADDAAQDYPSILRRLQGAIDRELSKWTSASTQPPGPSGETAVAEPQKAE
jgi:hypothetical protein